MKLTPSKTFHVPSGPVVEIIMDGVGLAPPGPGNAVAAAYTPVLDRLMSEHSMLRVHAHGTHVGLPSDDDMGNSEVGHNALGAGRIFDQGAKLVNRAIADGSIFEGETYREMVDACQTKGTFHFIGLCSDGNVHSHLDHLEALLRGVAKAGVRRVRVHPLLDGRDVGERTALTYLERLESVLSGLNVGGADFAIASGGGRMVTTMDRYEADWTIVERGWKAHVLGEGRAFASAAEAVRTMYNEDPDITDQFLDSFVVADAIGPVGTIEDGDAVLFFNFRGDRALEISAAFEKDDFSKFDRVRRPHVIYAGMMEYDGDYHIPAKYLVSPPSISSALSEHLCDSGISQFAIAETQKFGHVTYFWNGNRSGKFSEELETYREIPSDRVPFELRPWMQSAQVTDALIEAIESGSFRFLRVNYANGDMVGHTGVFRSAAVAVESVDLALERLLPVIARHNGVAVITADHGNADEMFMLKKGQIERDEAGDPVPKTSHTLNQVPYILYDPSGTMELDPGVEGAGLGNNAATIINLLGFEAPDLYLPSLLKAPV